MAKKKRKVRSTFFLKEPENVIVTPPAARLGLGSPTPFSGDIVHEGPPPWEDLFKESERERTSLVQEKRQLQKFATDVSDICLALTKMLIDSNHPAARENIITIPKWLSDQTRGASLETGHAPTGEKMVRLQQRGMSYIEPS